MPTLREKYPDLPSLLAAIRRRPGMFLGHQTIRGLNLFLGGFYFSEDLYDIPNADRLQGFERPQFEQWVDSKFNLERISMNSFYLAEHIAGSDAAGFDLWFRWYDEYSGRRLTAWHPASNRTPDFNAVGRS